jgi:hypothetical protein
MMGEEYILCNVSQGSLDDEHLPTFSLIGSGNPSRMKSIAIFLFFFNSFLDAVFSLFELSYPVETDFQISYPHASKNNFVLPLHISLFKPL